MIEVTELGFTYPGAERPALEGVSFQVASGEIFGFLGPNGAGKSTAQKILIGLLRDFSGKASVLGKDVEAWGNDFYEHIGVAFEFPNHYSKLTGFENLSYFRSLYADSAARPADLLQRVGLGDDGDLRVGQYSKGMKSKLSLARALLGDPELVFLDEPTSGLDPSSGRNIKGLIRDLSDQGKTIFLTTHDMTLADQLCDRVAFIAGGGIQVIDTPRNLKLVHGEHKVRVEYGSNGRTEASEFPMNALGKNDEFLELLEGGQVQTLHTQEATLEEIFIDLTGTSLS